ncbi:hypothetical protein ABZ330_34600 [Streptomyces sp. NPDC006172]|uniref:hypothetical protein n=1 Tax=Streptomyces sp. NPDC006172 TaxID=3154470 RepID=UPI0033C3CAE2
MRMFLEAASGLLGLLFTATLVVVVCFWLLVAVGAAAVDSFDTDADLHAWGMDGVPVAVAVSLLTVLAWLLGVGGTVLLVGLIGEGTASGLLRPVVSACALFVAWRLTRRLVRPLHRLFPDEPGPARPGVHDRAT